MNPPQVIDLTIPLDGLNVDQLLSHWRWLVPREFRPLQLTKFGDWFLVDSVGRVHHLDLIEGELTPVANSIAEYNTLKNEPDHQTDWFLDGFVFRCDHEGLNLQQGECYGWRVHPMIGGTFTFENIQTFTLSVYQALMGQLLPQWKQLKPGDAIPPISVTRA